MIQRRLSAVTRLVLVFVAPLLIVAGSALAGGLDDATGEQLARIVQGGVLYDSWFKALEVDPPKATHPAYAKTQGKQKGSSTWRCKECHGWDYLGKDGAYKKGSHFSGIIGIRGATAKSAEAIVQSLKGADHQLGGRIKDADLAAIAAFVLAGQLDMDDVIDRGSKKAKGSIASGARIYATVCAKCHGSDGKKINFGDEKEPEYVGTVAADNPWETLHKIRFGQPGKEMPGLVAFPVQVQADVLAYAQTLPGK